MNFQHSLSHEFRSYFEGSQSHIGHQLEDIWSTARKVIITTLKQSPGMMPVFSGLHLSPPIMDNLKASLMWDTLLFVLNMFNYHWLGRKWFWPMAGQNIARQEIQTDTGRKKVESERLQQSPEKQDMR